MKLASAAGGGLLLAFNWTNAEAKPKILDPTAEAVANSIEFNSYLSISPEGIITIFSPNPEVGQGIKTAFPIVVAEELDVDWKQVKVAQAPLNTDKFQRQVAGGSGSIPHSWTRLRQAGATARQLFINTAAKRWGVSPNECTTASGVVLHKGTSKKATYADLAVDASKMPTPTDVALKDPKDFKLIGTFIKNVDNEPIITGKPLFGLDFYREGMLYAMIKRPDAFGMKLKSVDATAAKAMPGIVDVITFENNVAVLGKSTWQVMKARKALKIAYEQEFELESTSDHDRIFDELLNAPTASVRRKDGDVEAAFKKAAKVVTSEYQCPFLPHNPMEPMNFFANVTADGAELIGPTQTPERARGDAAKYLKLPQEKVTVELTRMGGGFGRRLATDFVMEAVKVSALAKAPVKLIWSREDDMTGGDYRPAVKYRFEAALDEKGTMIGYKLRGAGINAGNPTRENNFPAGAVDNLLIDSAEHKSPITTGPWRAPITNFLAYAEQAFLDEVAYAAGKDPIAFRLELLEKAKKTPVGDILYDIDRMRVVTELVAEKAGWGKDKSKAQGFSLYFSHRSYVAQIGEVTMKNGKPEITKVYAGVDCGVVINQSGAQQQTMGGILDGIGHAMYGNLTFKDGVPEQSNYNNYRLIRMKNIPDVEVHFVDNGIDPTGLGEPALPPTGGAVANAIFKATGKRIYKQPFVEQDVLKGVS
jgi:isoquinoline 1-oxidoreductase beta subunit